MKIFNTKERLRRTDYFFQKTISFLLLINLIFVFMVVGENTENSVLYSISTILTVLFLFGFIVFDAISMIKRLHDLNKKGTWYFARFIPLYNIVFELGLVFERGIKGTNSYGIDPRTLDNKNFRKSIIVNSCLLAMLIFSIISITNFKKQQDLKLTSVIIENPKINDYFIFELEDTTGYNYNIFKIDNIVGDSITVTSAIYAYKSEFDADKALDENKNSGNDFWGEQEKIIREDLEYINISKARREKNWW